MTAWLLKNPLASILGAVLAIALALLGVQTVRLAWSQDETLQARNEFKDFKLELAATSQKAAEDMAAKSAAAADRAADQAKRAVDAAEQGKQEIANVYAAGGADLCNRARGAVVDGVQSVFKARTAAGGGAVGHTGPAAPAAMRGPATAGAGAARPGQ